MWGEGRNSKMEGSYWLSHWLLLLITMAETQRRWRKNSKIMFGW